VGGCDGVGAEGDGGIVGGCDGAGAEGGEGCVKVPPLHAQQMSDVS